MTLVSPVSGQALTPDTPHSLSDEAGERWPVVDGIPYLRVGREALVAAALAHLDAGRREDALVALLADHDDWWTGPATDVGDLRRLVCERDMLTLRGAMALLRLGPVADYFAYRWSDPTYLAGLALLEAHWNEPRSAFELACGIGHYLRELTRRGVACVGADVVFAKCWLAKHWVAPDAEYLVFDAGHGWPTGDARHDLVMCHDAFYFLPKQERVAQWLRNVVSISSCSSAARTPVERSETCAAEGLAALDEAPCLARGGMLAISHLHNGDYYLGAMGPAKAGDEWAKLFPTATVYDESELLDALLMDTAVEPTTWTDASSEAVEAWSIIEGEAPARPVRDGLVMPPPGARLRPNPLLATNGVRWPSDRYMTEYGPGSYWSLSDDKLDAAMTRDPVRLRRLVDLPEHW